MMDEKMMYSIENCIYSSEWRNVLDLLETSVTRGAKIWNLATSEHKTTNQHGCRHHTGVCISLHTTVGNKTCLCCGLKTEQQFCKCCK